MQKDFKKWSERKQDIHTDSEFPFCHEREIWWCALGTNIGFEQDGTGRNFDRPIIILKGFNKRTFFAVALTGRRREGRFYFPLGLIENREASAILSQVRVYYSKRLIRKIATLDEALFKKLKDSCRALLFPP